MRHVALAVEGRLRELHFSQKDFAVRWHTLVSRSGPAPRIETVMSELSRLLRGQERGFRFFVQTRRTVITAEALGWSVEQLLARFDILDRCDGRRAAGGAP